MSYKIVHARLDAQSDALLRRLRRRTGLSDSEILRSGLRALETMLPPARGREIVGLGRYSSRRRDLGSNARHLEGFGRK